MTFVTGSKKGFTARELKRPIGLSRYEMALNFCHKIHVLTGKQEDEYKLEGMVKYHVG